MTALRPDEGGNFASDQHRRVMCALANPDEEPISAPDLLRRLHLDDFFPKTVEVPGTPVSPPSRTVDQEFVTGILHDLVNDGDAEDAGNGFRCTQVGMDVLTGNNADNGGRNYFDVKQGAQQ